MSEEWKQRCVSDEPEMSQWLIKQMQISTHTVLTEIIEWTISA